MTEYEEIVLDGVCNIRRRNNDHWMEIVRIALTHAPTETKAVMKKIADLDQQVMERWAELAK